DILIEPDLGVLSAADFDKGAQFIALGEKATRAATETLRRYALPPDAYAAYRDSLRRPAQPAETELTFVGVRGTEVTNPAVLEAQVGVEPGAQLDLKQAQLDIATLYGRGDFDRIDYRLIPEGARQGVEFVVTEKPYGPNFLQFGVGFTSDTQGENYFGLRVRHKRTWLNELGGEWIND